MSSRRTNRVAALLQETIATLLLREAKDPGLAGVIVTDVDVSPDLRHARIYYRVLAPNVESERAQRALDRATGYIQATVGRALRLRYTPELQFVFDPSLDRARRLDALLEGAGGAGPAPVEGGPEAGIRNEGNDGRRATRR